MPGDPHKDPAMGAGSEPMEKCGIPGCYRQKCDSITHTKQQFAWLGVTRDLSRKGLVAGHVSQVFLGL